MQIEMHGNYTTIVPGTIVRAYDFNSTLCYSEGVIDGYFVSSDGKPHFCLEVSEDTSGQDREMILVPMDLGDEEWPDRLVELGVEDELLSD